MAEPCVSADVIAEHLGITKACINPWIAVRKTADQWVGRRRRFKVITAGNGSSADDSGPKEVA